MAKSKRINLVATVKRYAANVRARLESLQCFKTDVRAFLGVFIFALLLYSPTLRFLPVYDDGSAVFTNRDVRPELSTLKDLFTDDFWGAGMNSEISNTQYRPLTVLTFRADYIRGCLRQHKAGAAARRAERIARLESEKARLEDQERREELAGRRAKKEAQKAAEPEPVIPLEESKYIDVKNKRGNILPMPGFSVLTEELKSSFKPEGDISPEDNDEVVLRKLGWMYMDRPAIFGKPNFGRRMGADKAKLSAIQKRLGEIAAELSNPNIKDPDYEFLEDSPCVRTFRWTTLFMHAFACAMVYVTGRVVVRLGFYPALFAAVLFTAHPVHLESVSTLYGRADIFCADLMLISVNLAAGSALINQKLNAAQKKDAAKSGNEKKKAKKAPAKSNVIGEMDSDDDFNGADDDDDDYSNGNREDNEQNDKQSVVAVLMVVAAYVFAVLSIGTKEIGLASVAVLPLVQWAASGKRYPSAAMIIAAVCAIGLTLGIRRTLVHQWTPPITWFDNPYMVLPPTRLTRALSYAHIHACYLLYLFAPMTHAPNYGYDSIPCVLSITDPRNIGTVIAYAVVGLAALIIFVRKDWKALLLFVWAGGVFLPSSNIFFPVGTAFADRLLYIPSIPVCLLLAHILCKVCAILQKNAAALQKRGNKKLETRVFIIGSRRIEIENTAFTVSAVAVAVFAIALGVTMLRLPQWATPESVWSSVSKQLPDNILAHNNLAVDYIQQGRLRECFQETKAVIDIYEKSAFPVAREHGVYKTSLSMYKRLDNTLKDLDYIEHAEFATVIKETNALMQQVSGSQNMDAMYKAQIRCMAILSSGYLAKFPREEDIVASALTRINVFNRIGQEAYNLIHRTVIPRRIKNFGNDNLNMLRQLERSAKTGVFNEV